MRLNPMFLYLKEYPNLYIVPMLHNVDIYTTESVPLVLINFLVDDISLLKGEIMGFLTNSIFRHIQNND